MGNKKKAENFGKSSFVLSPDVGKNGDTWSLETFRVPTKSAKNNNCFYCWDVLTPLKQYVFRRAGHAQSFRDACEDGNDEVYPL